MSAFDRTFRASWHRASTVRGMLPRGDARVSMIFAEPVETAGANGGRRVSIGFPALIVPDIVADQVAFAEAVTRALNAAPSTQTWEGDERVHELKCWPEFHAAVMRGDKPWELRDNDRDFRVGDVLWLRGWEPGSGAYDGQESFHRVTYMLEGAGDWLPTGKCILSLAPMPPRPEGGDA
jgi:hypothetical protein